MAFRLACAVAVLAFAACDHGGKIRRDSAADAADDAVAGCPSIQSAGTMHTASSLAASEIWGAAGSPHLLPGDVTIGESVTLTGATRRGPHGRRPGDDRAWDAGDGG